MNGTEHVATEAQEQALPELRPVEQAVDLLQYDLPHARPFVCTMSVAQQHISRVIPHVSNIEYVRWLDRAAELHSDACGYQRSTMLAENIMWFVARHEIDYLAEAWLDDHLLIITWVREVRKVKSWREYVIIRPADDTIICRAATLWVLVNLRSRRPTRIPRSMAEALQPLVPFVESQEKDHR